MKRRELVAKTVTSSVFYYLLTGVMGFVTRKVFADYLGQDIIGLNGLMANVVSMLSLLELGISGSIAFSLYKPLQEHNDVQVKAIMMLFGKAYRIIGIVIAAVGVVFLPVLPLLVKTELPDQLVTRTYLLFLANTAATYLISYRRIIIQASEHDYINRNVDSIVFFVTSIFRILVIVLWKAYLLSLIISLVFCVIGNFYLHRKAGLAFPYLEDKSVAGKLDDDIKANIVKNVKALFVINIASYLVFGTDNILLSALINVSVVAVYSSYTTIITLVNSLFNNVFSYIIPNVGNYIVSESKENAYDLYKKVYFSNFVICCYTSVSMLVLMTPFIRDIWLDDTYIFELPIVAVLVFNNYSRYITKGSEAFRGAAGLYSPKPFVKYLALFEGLINLVFSIFFARTLGLGVLGVFFGTMVSTVVSTISVPWIIHRFLFERSQKYYWKQYFVYMFWFVVCSGVSVALYSLLETGSGIANFIIGAVISAVVTFVPLYLRFGKTEEGRWVLDIARSVIRKLRSRKEVS